MGGRNECAIGRFRLKRLFGTALLIALAALWPGVTGVQNAKAGVPQLPQDNGSFLFVFDDTYKSVLTHAYPVLSAKGWQGTAFISPYVVVGRWTSKLTEADLRTLYAQGWDISSHGWRHEPPATLDDDALTHHLKDAHDWLVERGFERSARHYTPPNGACDARVLAEARKYYQAIRMFWMTDTCWMMPKRYNYTVVRAHDSSVSWEELQALIDATDAPDEVLVMNFHNLVDANPTNNQTSLARFSQIVDYLYAHDKTVFTFSQLMDALADVTISESCSAGKVEAGEAVHYTLTYRNDGPFLARNVVMMDSLPAGLEYVSSSPAGIAAGNGTYRWELGTLESGVTGSVEITAEVKMAATGTLRNQATIATTSPESTTGNNQAEALVQVVPAAPKTGTLVPNGGVGILGQAISLTTTYSDANGWQNIESAALTLNVSRQDSEGLYAAYNQNLNRLTLRSDDGSTWAGECTPGQTGALSNSTVRLDCGATTVQGSGTALSITWHVTPLAPFSDRFGPYRAFLQVTDDSGLVEGWNEVGVWTLQGYRYYVPWVMQGGG